MFRKKPLLRSTCLIVERFAVHLPNPDWVTAEYAALADLLRGLSGGNILTVCVNAIHAGRVDPNTERRMVTQELLEQEIRKLIKAKAEHSE